MSGLSFFVVFPDRKNAKKFPLNPLKKLIPSFSGSTMTAQTEKEGEKCTSSATKILRNCRDCATPQSQRLMNLREKSRIILQKKKQTLNRKNSAKKAEFSFDMHLSNNWNSKTVALSFLINIIHIVPLAQPVEQAAVNRLVAGSSPVRNAFFILSFLDCRAV